MASAREKTLWEWLEGLRDPDPYISYETRRELEVGAEERGEIDQLVQVVDHIIGILEDGTADPATHHGIVLVGFLANHARKINRQDLIPVTAVPTLNRLLLDDRRTYVAAYALIGIMRKDAVPTLLAALNHESPFVRIDILREFAAEGIDEPKVIVAMADHALHDADIKVRIRALEDIGELLAGRRQVPAAVMSALKDESPFVAMAAAEALGRIDPTSALPIPLIGTYLKHPDIKVRLAAPGNLLRVVDERGLCLVPDLLALLNDPKHPPIGSFEDSRTAIQKCLERIGPAAVPLMSAALAESGPIEQCFLAEALETLKL